MDKWFHPTSYWACGYFFMFGFKLIHVSKKGLCRTIWNQVNGMKIVWMCLKEYLWKLWWCGIFIRPFEKRDVLCRGNVRPSVCPSVRLSVRPSVRPRFPDFSSTCFEISIWNLVYAFSRWHDMSSLSCITIGSIWPSLRPKVGQTYFLQSWPH